MVNRKLIWELICVKLILILNDSTRSQVTPKKVLTSTEVGKVFFDHALFWLWGKFGNFQLFSNLAYEVSIIGFFDTRNRIVQFILLQNALITWYCQAHKEQVRMFSSFQVKKSNMMGAQFRVSQEDKLCKTAIFTLKLIICLFVVEHLWWVDALRHRPTCKTNPTQYYSSYTHKNWINVCPF